MRAKLKPLISSPPKINKANKTSNVVNDVTMVLPSVCDILVGAGRYSSTRVKHYDTSAAHIAASIDHSLRLMGTEKIDLLLVPPA
jgi:predicted oxidoreductase